MTDCNIRLGVRRRPEPQHGDPQDSTASWNLFARLSPAIAKQLHDIAFHQSTLQRTRYPHSSGWTVSSEGSPRCASGVEFLPLVISFGACRTVYVSYNGGDLLLDDPETTDTNIIDLPSFMIPEGVNEVDVAVLSFVENACDLHVEPLTVDDWVLLEANAAWLEQGGLLQQVSLAYSGQVLTLCAGGRDVVRVKVNSTNFDSSPVVWPGDDNEASLLPRQSLRLVADTQVIVAPKIKTNVEDKDKVTLRAVPAALDYSASMLELADHIGVSLTDVAPFSAVVHPATLAVVFPDNSHSGFVIVHILSSDAQETPPSDETKSAVVHLSTCLDVPEDSIVLHPLVRVRLKLECFHDKVKVVGMSSMEATTRAGKLADLVRTGHVRLALKPVGLQTARTARPWRYPETESFGVASSPKCIDKALELSAAAFVLPPLCDRPVEVGALLTLFPDHLEQIFELVICWPRDEMHLKGLGMMNPFILAQDMTLLLRRSVSSRDSLLRSMHSQSEIDQVQKANSILDPLPAGSVFTSTLLGGVPRAMKSHHCMVYGERGSGKTHTAMAFSAFGRLSFGCATFYLDCKKLKNSRAVRMADILAELSKLFADALQCSSPALIVLDGLDELAPCYDEGGKTDDSTQVQQVNPLAVDQSKLIADTFRQLVHTVDSADGTVFVVVTCRDAGSLPTSIMSTFSFGHPVQLPVIISTDRETLYRQMLHRQDLSENTGRNDNSLPGFVQKTEGFRPRDIQQLASRVNRRLLPLSYTGHPSLFEATSIVLDDLVPLCKLSAAMEATRMSPDWDDVGGLFRVKEELASTILRPFTYRRVYEKARIRLPRGVLLFGPPGVGKTYLVPALAKECGFPLITCRGPELLDKYIGASEAKVRELFARAAAAAPSILFLDELDSLAPRRGSDHTGVTDRVVNQLLTFLDGVEDTQRSGTVYVIAATSRPDKIDAALLRPGRLEKHIYVGLPDQENEWTDLLVKTASKYSVCRELLDSIASGQFIRQVLEKFPHVLDMSPADLRAVFDTAQVCAVHEALSLDQIDNGVSLRSQDLIEAFPSTRASLSRDESLRLQEIYRPFLKDGSERSGRDSQRESLPREPVRTALK